jgi:hypothetical protein
VEVPVSELSEFNSFARETSRRTVVRTGIKLAYAAPLVAASYKLTANSALAQSCDCTGIEGGVVDETPYGGGPTSCCTCEHSKEAGRGGTFGDVIYPGAFYNPTTNLCADTTPPFNFPNGFSPTYCAPICSGCLGIS